MENNRHQYPKTHIAFLLILVFANFIQAQTEYRIINQTATCRKLQIRPTLELGIFGSEGDFGVFTKLEAQYWINQKLDIKFGSIGGNYNGLILGGTFHSKDQLTTRKEKFIYNEIKTEKSTTRQFYKAQANVHQIAGPTVEFRGGLLPKIKGGLYTELRGGWDWQSFSRNYIEIDKNNTYPGNKNGYFSIKLLGQLAFYKGAKITGYNNNEFGIGTMAHLTAVKSPWKSITFTGSLDLGATYWLGEGVIPIISPGFGLCINLIKSKELKAGKVEY